MEAMSECRLKQDFRIEDPKDFKSLKDQSLQCPECGNQGYKVTGCFVCPHCGYSPCG
jgi:hypothetical protein